MLRLAAVSTDESSGEESSITTTLQAGDTLLLLWNNSFVILREESSDLRFKTQIGSKGRVPHSLEGIQLHIDNFRPLCEFVAAALGLKIRDVSRHVTPESGHYIAAYKFYNIP